MRCQVKESSHSILLGIGQKNSIYIANVEKTNKKEYKET